MSQSSVVDTTQHENSQSIGSRADATASSTRSRTTASGSATCRTGATRPGGPPSMYSTRPTSTSPRLPSRSRVANADSISRGPGRQSGRDGGLPRSPRWMSTHTNATSSLPASCTSASSPSDRSASSGLLSTGVMVSRQGTLTPLRVKLGRADVRSLRQVESEFEGVQLVFRHGREPASRQRQRRKADQRAGSDVPRAWPWLATTRYPSLSGSKVVDCTVSPTLRNCATRSSYR